MSDWPPKRKDLEKGIRKMYPEKPGYIYLCAETAANLCGCGLKFQSAKQLQVHIQNKTGEYLSTTYIDKFLKGDRNE